MKQVIFFSLVASFILCSCNRNTPKTPEVQQVGDFDSSAVAQDTVMQRTLESSYEYAKTLNINPNLAYDIRAYGGSASKGEYAILRRAAGNRADTVAKGERDGIIADVLMGDLNGNGDMEIYIIFQSADSLKKGKIVAYELNEKGKAANISTSDYIKAEKNSDYRGKDSIYIEHQMIVRKFPVYGKENKPVAWLVARYALIKNELLLNSKEGLKYN